MENKVKEQNGIIKKTFKIVYLHLHGTDIVLLIDKNKNKETPLYG